MRMRRAAMTVVTMAAAALCPAAAIEIDGAMTDWEGVAALEMPAEVAAQAQSPFGVVERLWIAHDQQFLYFRLRFARPRPFADETQSAWQPSYWANTRYIILDVNGDAQPDFYTNQIARPEGGLNHTYVVRYTDDGPKTYLWYEGHADWHDGPRGHYSPDGREIEIRVPREPLAITGTVLGVRVQMSLRDGLEGPNAWTNDRYPSPDTWFLYDLAAGNVVEAAATAGPPAVEITRADAAPAIDGALDDAAWQGAPVLGDFILNRGGAPAAAQTQARLAWDDRNLYLAVRADEPDMANLRTDAVEAEAKRVWRDDLIELFIDFHNDDRTFVHLGLTAAGALAGQFGVVQGGSSASIDIEPAADIAWSRGADFWTIEAAIAWANLGVRPVAGETWGLNICRGRPAAGEYSSWAGVQGGFAQPTLFGDLVVPSDTGLQVLSRGMAARAGNASQANTLRGVLAPEAATSLTASVRVAAGGAESFADTLTVDAPAGRATEFALPYVVTGAEGETVEFAVNAGDRELYRNTIPVVQTDFPKVWTTRAPVYEELLGEDGPGMAAEGVIYWSHDLTGYEIAPVCLKYAQPWTLAGAYQNAAEHELRYLDGGTLLGRDPFATRRYAEELGVRVIAMGSHRAHVEGKPVDASGYAYLGDYENQQVYLDRLRAYIEEWRPFIWGVSTGDEVHEHDLTLGLRFHYGEQGPYPFMEQVDAEVRAEFGYGKYGIPESLDDRDPFRWIAYRRWYNDRFAQFQQRIYEMVKAIDPALLVIGPDPVAQVQPLDYSGWGRWCDIATHQCYPRGPAEQDFAWIAKTVRDLTGVATMPCAHVEHYANSFRPDEVLELMSQVYRGGGEGFHLYMPDTAGARTPHDLQLDQFCSWPRWRTVMGTLDRTRTMNRPVYPESRAAILFSNDAYMAQFLGSGQGDDPYRWMFNLLGPYAGGWFTVISDNQVARGDLDLSRFSVIYVPAGEHQRREVVEALVTWVEGGGRLVVTDPAAFTWHLDGTRMDDLRARLFPAMGAAVDAQAVTVAAGAGLEVTGEIPAFGPLAALQLAEGDRPLLVLPDGSAAAAVRPVGAGEVYSFGFQPMYQRALGAAQWTSFWRAFHAAMGESVDLPIWRFTFPAVPGAAIEPPEGRCLTGNYVVWDTNEMVPMANVEVDGRYSYSVAPDLGADEGGVTDIPFARGDLMDRRTAPAHNDEDYTAHLRTFAVGWRTVEPVTIDFDLGAAYPLDRIWLLFSGQLPDTVVSGLVGEQWRNLGQAARQTVENSSDFPAVAIDLAADAPPVQRLRIELGARDEGQRLIIPEVEIWAREQ